MTAALIAGAAAMMLLGLDRLRPSLPVVMPGYTGWHGDYSDVASWAAWTLGDTTEPGYAHSALAGATMLLGGYLAHRAFRSKHRMASWFPRRAKVLQAAAAFRHRAR